MAKKQQKQFSPHIYQEWGELFKHLSDKQKSEILMAITMYPNYNPDDNPIWGFIKSQIEIQFVEFNSRCAKNGEISRDYWNRMKSNDTERIPNDTERHPKLELELEQELEYKHELKENKEKSEMADPDKVKSLVKSVSIGKSSSLNKNKILISDSLVLVDCDDEQLPVHLYLAEYGEKVILDVQNWLIQNKLGQKVDKSFICRQFNNFAARQRR